LNTGVTIRFEISNIRTALQETDLHVDEQFAEIQCKADETRQVTDCQCSLQVTELTPASTPLHYNMQYTIYPLTTAVHHTTVIIHK